MSTCATVSSGRSPASAAGLLKTKADDVAKVIEKLNDGKKEGHKKYKAD